MSQKYADIIIDISHEAVDRTFQYIIPEELQGSIEIGQQVLVPFGNGKTERRKKYRGGVYYFCRNCCNRGRKHAGKPYESTVFRVTGWLIFPVNHL